MSEAAAAFAALLLGIFSNEEQVRFAEEAGAAVPPFAALEISGAGSRRTIRAIDAFGHPQEDELHVEVVADPSGVVLQSVPPGCRQRFVRAGEGFSAGSEAGSCSAGLRLLSVGPSGLGIDGGDGQHLELRRARPVTCWAAIPRATPLPDGRPDWWFRRGISLFDQGGMALLATDEPQPQRFELKMRNVVWPSGPNQPSLVLYVHQPGQARAIAYAWADPGAVRVGLNIRTVQASCTLSD